MLQGFETLFPNDLLMLHEPWYFWTPGLNWLQVSSHALIVIFYYSISILVIYVLSQRGAIPYAGGILLLLGAFALASGTTHVMEIWAVWYPNSWLARGIEANTAATALFTVLLGGLLLPKVLVQPRSVSLRTSLKTIFDFNYANAAANNPVDTSRASAPALDNQTLDLVQTQQLDSELEQQVNEQIAALQRNNPQLKSEIHGRVRWLEELGLLQSLCALISEAPDFHSALCVALRLVCEVTNWDYGEAWLPRADNSALECTPAWYSKTMTLEEFRLSTQKLTLPPNTGLPGRVWTSRRPEWIEDFSALADTSAVRPQAQTAGLKSAFGVPILMGDRVLAVLTFFLTQSRAISRTRVSSGNAIGISDAAQAVGRRTAS
jgi:hypothetical protein